MEMWNKKSNWSLKWVCKDDVKHTLISKGSCLLHSSSIIVSQDCENDVKLTQAAKRQLPICFLMQKKNQFITLLSGQHNLAQMI
mmetsp:Transcript_42932/g.43534  ORF Transcript_42932/g.43534 Transcript_42932/m.43534 type:complete len:84 (-) Transcript_42932:195-446(-)